MTKPILTTFISTLAICSTPTATLSITKTKNTISHVKYSPENILYATAKTPFLYSGGGPQGVINDDYCPYAAAITTQDSGNARQGLRLLHRAGEIMGVRDDSHVSPNPIEETKT